MSGPTDVELIADILEAADRIAMYINGLDDKAFASDIKTQDATIRNLEIVGEATKNLSQPFRASHSGVP